tara:strand:+ start:15940 stop:19062 length:3123 start_codon:yes stop_codon:yes gene_type:complete
MKIVHIADIHWRGLSRHEEYKSSFRYFFKDIKEKNPDIIYIGGDIVHSKTHGISPELIESLSWWFNSLAEIAPTHIILGNHDGLILNKDRQDTITPIIEAIKNPNIYLYKNSGVYEIKNETFFSPRFNLCVLSCFDEDEWKNVLPDPDAINICCFHGAVERSRTDSNWMLDAEISLEELQKFDFSLLGDIHKYQYLDKEKRIAYPGSSIQQNYGEARKKGYILWNIESKDEYSSEFFEIKNDFPFITLPWKGNVKSTCLPEKCEENAKFRIKSNYSLGQKSIKEISQFLKKNYKAQEVVFKVDRKQNNNQIIENASKISLGKNDRNYIKEVVKDYYSFDENITDSDHESMGDVIDKCFDQLKTIKKQELTWDLEKLEFSNLFSYGENNIVDLTGTSGLTGIFGKNRTGKSSIVGAILYTLFNASDRGTIKNEHIVNKRKTYGEGIAYINSGGIRYKIVRRTDIKQTRKNTSYGTTSLNIYIIDENDETIENLTGEQRRDTENTLRKIVGITDDFLMTSIAAQGSMNNFISLSSSARKGIINKFLNVNIFDELYNIVREESQETRILLNKLDARDWDYEINSTQEKIKIKNENLRLAQEKKSKCKERLEEIVSNNKNLNSKFTHKDLDDINKKIKENIRKTNLFESTLISLNSRFLKIEENLDKADSFIKSVDLFEIKEIKEMRSDTERQIMKLKNMLSVEENELKRIKKSAKILDEVPCGETFLNCKFIKNSHKDKLKIPKQEEKISELKGLLKTSNKTLRGLCKRDIDKELENHDLAIKKQNQLLREKVKYKSDIDKITNNIDILQIDLNEYNNKKVKIRDILAANDNAEILKIIDNLKKSLQTFDSQIIRLSKDIGMLENKLEITKQDRITFETLGKSSRVYDALLSAFSKKGIPVFLIKKVLPQINNEIRDSIESLVGFTVEIEYSQKDELEIYINYGDSRRIIELCSGMEKMMASLAIRFVLTNLSTLPRSSMLVIDEGFGALDSGNIDACNEFLDSMKKWYKNILIISHIDVIKDSVDNIMEITRNGIDSKVVFQ